MSDANPSNIQSSASASSADDEKRGQPIGILVAGMHRSGTSAITRSLHLMGATLPKNLVQAEKDNEDGFWESRDVIRAHDDFLAALGSNWRDPRPLPACAFDSAPAEACRARLHEILDRNFASKPLWVIKDPRICKVMPLWRDVVENFGAEPRYVLPIRNPLEVALSLHRREHMSSHQALALWLIHVLFAERASRGLRRVFTSYDAFHSDPVAAAVELGNRLGCFSQEAITAGIGPIEAQWSKGLRHHAVPDHHLERDAKTPQWIGETYRWLTAAIAGHEPPTSELDRMGDSLVGAMELYGPLMDVLFLPPSPPSLITRARRKVARQLSRRPHSSVGSGA